MGKLYYQEYRCPHDNKLLFKGVLVDSEIQIKCRHCKNLIKIQGIDKEEMVCKKISCPNRV